MEVGERVKIFAPRSLVLVFSAACFLSTPAFAQESGDNSLSGFWPLSVEYVAEGTYVGEGDVQRGPRKTRHRF